MLSINVPSYRGRRYVVTFVDAYSRMLCAEALAHKSDVFGASQRFKGEYTPHKCRDFLAKDAIRDEMPCSPRAKGITEQINHTIVEGLILSAQLIKFRQPRPLWAEALLAFVSVKNWSWHAALAGGVLLAVWRGKPVRVDMLWVWNCCAHHTVTNGCAKIDNKAVPLVFIGYDGHTAAYRLFDPVTRKTV